MNESQPNQVPSPEQQLAQQGIIDKVPQGNSDIPASTGPEYKDYDYDPNNALTAPQQVDTTKDSILSGPRQTGQYMIGNQLNVAAVSPDGMKYSKQYGSRFDSVSDFHRQAGVAQDYEMGTSEKAPRISGLRKAGRQVLHMLHINHPPKYQ